MPRYVVYYQATAIASVEVEAEAREDAWEEAEKLFSSPQPCYHCSREFDLGDFEPVIEEWGTEVIEDA